MDFTLKTYCSLIYTLQNQGFSYSAFADFIARPSGGVIILRHDVDSMPGNSLIFAEIEAGRGIRGTYYFRAVPESFDEDIIRRISELGHEVGYHYEDVSLAADRLRAQGTGRRAKESKKYVVGSKEDEEFEKQLVNIAIESFKENLDKLRQIVPVKTICMHGSPMSRWDSRLLWKYYDYHDFGITGEPYFDIDFNQVLYLTDTGRRWDGESVSVRDKASGDRRQATGENPYKDWKVKPFKYKQIVQDTAPSTVNRTPRTAHRVPFPKFHSTFDIIKAANEGRLPAKIMMTFHPQRWTDKPVPWVKELVWQNVKNIGKYFVVKLRK